MKIQITKLTLITLAFGCILSLTGCMSTQIGTAYNSDNVTKLKVGETTEQDVIQLIGEPYSRSRNSDGTVVLSYMYNAGTSVNPFSGFDPNFVQKAQGKMKTLTVIIDANGKLKSYQEGDRQPIPGMMPN
jgi:outer membrane protein assembly factor BamE (lipoprotein component of BamABCDE complex)